MSSGHAWTCHRVCCTRVCLQIRDPLVRQPFGFPWNHREGRLASAGEEMALDQMGPLAKLATEEKDGRRPTDPRERLRSLIQVS